MWLLFKTEEGWGRKGHEPEEGGGGGEYISLKMAPARETSIGDTHVWCCWGGAVGAGLARSEHTRLQQLQQREDDQLRGVGYETASP